MPQVASTSCRVVIVAPNGQTFQFAQEDYHEHLLAVETQKDLGQAVGSFTLHFTAIRDQENRRWDERIPRRSLVFIAMERDDPDLTVTRPVVMLGLTDDHGMQERWSEARPQRHVQVSGREIASVLLDATLIYHAKLALSGAQGTLTLTKPTSQIFAMALAWNPNLAQSGEDPKVILSRILDYLLFVGGTAIQPSDTPGLQEPVMQLDLPRLALTDILDKNADAWSTFEPVQVPMPYAPTEAGSVWNYLHIYIDRSFQEFFTRVEDGICKIHFRGKPFRHAYVTSGSRFKESGPGGEPGPEREPTLLTLTLDPAHLLSRTTQCQTANVYNYFVVSPMGLTDRLDVPSLLYQVLPQVITDPAHPSFVGRYGLRPMRVQSPYIAPFVPGPSQATTPPQPLTPPPVGAATYADLANQLAAAQGIPPPLRPWFVANIEAESSFDPMATSHAGAQGLGQLMPATQALLGVTNPYDPTASLTGSAQYWNILRADPAIGDNPTLLVAAYNAGPQAIHDYHGIPPFPETQHHVRKVTAMVPRYQGYSGVTVPAGVAAPGASPPPTPAQQAAFQTVIETAQRWAAILRSWYDMGGELFGGTLTVRGHPAWNVGHRLLSWDERGEWEAYIEGVSHQYDMRTGQYITQLRITRGWYLTEAAALQLWVEGQTTITETSGGPPLRDPVTGEVLAPGPGGAGPRPKGFDTQGTEETPAGPPFQIHIIGIPDTPPDEGR